MKKDEDTIVIDQDFDQSAPDVWNAITEISEMRKWYFENILDFKAELGFCTQLLVKSGDGSFLHLWKVIEVVSQRKLVYNWKYEGIAGESCVSFEVSGEEQSSHLKLTHSVLEDFLEDIPEFKQEGGVECWTYSIKDRLKTYLDG